ncbi:hypothetical protein EB796_015881 [Bugula neritina]|uniref:Uncharacterized protein n=1 Tax=Bugula neritina TaxID=10212 RepID=A0A7J7JHI6_BUGNE|nr:hypothetical protein EB796_015881 [Bugula neritina]
MNYKIAETMNTEAKARNTQFQLTLGDNIYYYGKTFEDLYSGEYLQNDWYMIAGNHDYWVTSVLKSSTHRSPRGGNTLTTTTRRLSPHQMAPPLSSLW